MSSAILEVLVGEEINAVSFVMDYVEFHFNGPILRSLTPPILLTKKGRIQFPEAGSRDALCSLIGDTVEAAIIKSEKTIELRLKSGRILSVPLDMGSRKGPEAAHFVPGINQPLTVW